MVPAGMGFVYRFCCESKKKGVDVVDTLLLKNPA